MSKNIVDGLKTIVAERERDLRRAIADHDVGKVRRRRSLVNSETYLEECDTSVLLDVAENYLRRIKSAKAAVESARAELEHWSKNSVTVPA